MKNVTTFVIIEDEWKNRALDRDFWPGTSGSNNCGRTTGRIQRGRWRASSAILLATGGVPVACLGSIELDTIRGTEGPDVGVPGSAALSGIKFGLLGPVTENKLRLHGVRGSSPNATWGTSVIRYQQFYLLHPHSKHIHPVLPPLQRIHR